MKEQTFYVKDKIVNISDFVGDVVSATNTQLCPWREKAAKDNTKQMGLATFQ